MMRRITTSAVLVAAVAAAFAAPALAEERTCRGSLGAITVDTLRVPQGATCRLNGTRVEGTVKVENRATLKATRIRVKGNVQAEGSASVRVAGSRIGGSIQIVQSRGASLSRNAVNADIQLFGNRGTLTVSSNRIDGNLQCKENTPAPTGGGNVVRGNKEDQCRRL